MFSFFRLALGRNSSFSYHPRATPDERTAVALQFGRGEGLVDILDGVCADHRPAPGGGSRKSHFKQGNSRGSGEIFSAEPERCANTVDGYDPGQWTQ